MASEVVILSKSALITLWTHECYRVFSDRLIDDEDRLWFTTKFGENLKKIPDENDSPVVPEVYANYIFGDFYDNDKEYKLIPDIEKDMPKILNERYLSVYNS